MGRIHDLVLTHGRDGARTLTNEEEWPLVDVAAAVLAEESGALGITYSGFCMTALPHRKIPDSDRWRRTAAGGKFEMIIEPGELRIKRRLHQFGVPYGSRARLILLYLQTKAIQSNCPQVELGRSMRDWMIRLGASDGGQTYAAVREQQNRLSACRLTFYWDGDQHEGFQKTNIIAGGIHLKTPNDGRQGTLWEERVTLGDDFFQALKAHPVPIWEPAIRQIASESMTIDVYIWLAYRLRSLERPTPITWLALHGQFGAGYKNVYHFKPRFLACLQMALAVYPNARVDVNEKTGLTLHPSNTPIGEAKVHRVIASK